CEFARTRSGSASRGLQVLPAGQEYDGRSVLHLTDWLDRCVGLSGHELHERIPRLHAPGASTLAWPVEVAFKGREIERGCVWARRLAWINRCYAADFLLLRALQLLPPPPRRKCFCQTARGRDNSNGQAGQALRGVLRIFLFQIFQCG